MGVYEISVQTGLDAHITAVNRMNLRKDIAYQARKRNVQVYFHRPVAAATGSMSILLECPESFLDHVRALHLATSVMPIAPLVQTEREPPPPPPSKYPGM